MAQFAYLAERTNALDVVETPHTPLPGTGGYEG